MPMTANEAAARLGLAPTTFRQKLRDGVVPGRLEKGRWVVEEEDLAAYVHRAGDNYTANSTTHSGPSDGHGAMSGEVSGMDVVHDDSQLDQRAGAWLLLAVGEDRAFGSNDGYRDVPATHYRWDDTVPNHRQIKKGDAVVLWDKKTSIGASVIESIETAENTKSVYSCPYCGKAHIKARKTKQPRYRCFNCGSDFDEPVTTPKNVTESTATYGASWVDLNGLLDGAILRGLCVSPKSQLSMRPLDWDRFHETIVRAGGPELLTVLEASKRTIQGGHYNANVRVRIGQGSFRRDLLATAGAVCVFTGPTPAVALEAAHLYSYARVGEHREHGGLLMRRDLHRLFDLGFIAVDPRTLTIDVAPSLAMYPAYAALKGRSLSVTLRGQQVAWLQEHWEEHRAGSIKSP
jgi:predicted RNA-binding Zn-ribbon protein involved in translation (DUF1610 family)